MSQPTHSASDQPTRFRYARVQITGMVESFRLLNGINRYDLSEAVVTEMTSASTRCPAKLGRKFELGVVSVYFSYRGVPDAEIHATLISAASNKTAREDRVHTATGVQLVAKAGDLTIEATDVTMRCIENVMRSARQQVVVYD